MPLELLASGLHVYNATVIAARLATLTLSATLPALDLPTSRSGAGLMSPGRRPAPPASAQRGNARPWAYGTRPEPQALE